MPVIETDRPSDARHFLEGFAGFRVAMDEDGLLMLASTGTPTAQVVVAWLSETAVDPELLSAAGSLYAIRPDRQSTPRATCSAALGSRRALIAPPA